MEEGHSEGIITSKLDRFGRDLIGGALALKRITEADGRLVCVEDGFDSASPGSELMFNLRTGRVGKQVPPVEQRVEVYWAGATKRARRLRWTAAKRKLAESIRVASA